MNHVGNYFVGFGFVLLFLGGVGMRMDDPRALARTVWVALILMALGLVLILFGI